jgi:hypothetical protein
VYQKYGKQASNAGVKVCPHKHVQKIAEITTLMKEELSVSTEDYFIKVLAKKKRGAQLITVNTSVLFRRRFCH